MARNAEKAMTTLARWRAAQMDGEKTVERKRRPFLASECEDLADAERFRLDIIRQISKRVTQIQNAGLGEFRLRDLNDQINRFLREKRHWEQRIVELGGANYAKSSSFDSEGREVPGNRGYKYFGAAKDLPGVRELFAQSAPPPPRKTRAELMLHVDAAYYGFQDEDDGVLLPLELEAERKAVAAALSITPEEAERLCQESCVALERDGDDGSEFIGPRRFVSHVPSVPTLDQVQQHLLQRKKQQLLQELMESEDPES